MTHIDSKERWWTEVSLRCSWPKMAQVFLFVWSWTDQFWPVNPWFQDRHDSEPPTAFLAYNMLYIRGPTIKKIVYYIPNQARSWTRDPRTRIDRSRTTEEGELEPFRVGNNAKKLPAGLDQKKTKKITDQLGPSGPRTKRSLDSCLERPFGDGPVKSWIDSNFKKLHCSLKSHHLSLESIWVIPYESYFLHFHYQWLFVHWKSTHKLWWGYLFRVVHPS